MIGLAVILAAVAGWAAAGPADRLRRLRPPSPRASQPVRLWRWLGLTCAGAALAGVVWPVAMPVSLIAMIASTISWLAWGKISARRAASRLRQCLRVAQIMEAMLALGHLPGVAIGFAAEECPVVTPVAAAVRLGDNPADVLRAVARLPGCASLAWIGQAWQATQVSGAGLTEALGVIRATMEGEAETAAVVTGELAGPRATSRLLALLPLLGLMAAWAMGVDLVGFFVSRVGGLCLVAGTALACAGLIWSELVARQAEPVWQKAGANR